MEYQSQCKESLLCPLVRPAGTQNAGQIQEITRQWVCGIRKGSQSSRCHLNCRDSGLRIMDSEYWQADVHNGRVLPCLKAEVWSKVMLGKLTCRNAARLTGNRSLPIRVIPKPSTSNHTMHMRTEE